VRIWLIPLGLGRIVIARKKKLIKKSAALWDIFNNPDPE